MGALTIECVFAVKQVTQQATNYNTSHLHQANCSIYLQTRYLLNNVNVKITQGGKQTQLGHEKFYRDRLARYMLAPTRLCIRGRHFWGRG